MTESSLFEVSGSLATSKETGKNRRPQGVRKLRVVRLIARMNVGGPARHVTWLTAGLQHAGYRSWLVKGNIGSGEVDLGGFALEHGVHPITIPDLGREISAAKDMLVLFRFYRLLRRFRPDIIHTHTAKAGTTGRLAAALYKWLTPGTILGRPRAVKIIHTFHGNVFSGYYGPWKTMLFLWIERLLARCATDRIIVICQQQLEELQGTLGIGKKRQYEVISLGLDLHAIEGTPNHRRGFREELGARSDELLVGIVGRLVKIKNHELFLQAAALVHRKLRDVGSRPRVRFVVIGEGDRQRELALKARELGLDSEVLFLGHRDDAQRFYAGLDVIALTSLNEGTPLTLLEAMMNSRPVIATRVGGVPGIVGEPEGMEPDVSGGLSFVIGERGILAPSGDAAAFAAGLVHLLRDEDLRRRLGDNGSRFVRARFSKDRLVLDMQGLYDGLTRRS
jgi:glycosyltransferase involved in cell wall biosynthesis